VRTRPFDVFVSPRPPHLTARVAFEEPSGNRALDALEEGALVVTLENSGRGDAYEVAVVAEWAVPPKGVTLASRTPVGALRAGASQTLRLPLAAAESAPDQSLRLTLRFPEGGGFDADPVELAFDTRAFAPPQLILADFGIEDGSGNGQVEPAEVVEVTCRVQNVGQGDAVDVTARVQLGQNVMLAGSGAEHRLGNLVSGAHADFTFSFFTNKRVQAGQTLPLAVALREGRGRFEAEAPIGIVLNAPQKSRSQVVVEAVARQGGGEVERAGGLSVDVDQNVPQGAAKNPHAVAVVIGNTDYQHTSNVEFAKNDAASVRRYLVETLGYDPANILYKENATLADFSTLFGRAGGNSKLRDYLRPDGTSEVFVYYSGHGVPSQSEGGSPYFVPVDADPNYIGGSGYPAARLREVLAALPARAVTVVLDACFSGSDAAGQVLLRDVSPAALKVKDEVAAPPGAVYMASATSEQVSTWYRDKKHGMFTYWWLKGVGGAADVNGDKAVTVGELKTYLETEVPYNARRALGQTQTPVIMGDAAQVVVRLK